MKKTLFALGILFLGFTSIKAQRSAPVIPEKGAFETGNYRNVLAEAGYTQTEIDAKLENAWQHLFYGDDENERVYYPVGDDLAYVKDINNNDVRSEGMSYGMMICVQLDKKEEFDRLWKWSKQNLQHQSGSRIGYFSWQTDIEGKTIDPNPASDGEIYFATALYFASARWGNGSGIYDYQAEADYILRVIQDKDNVGDGITNMFNKDNNQVVFTPIGDAALYTDASYHLPSFYEVWARVADENNDFWKGAVTASHNFFPTTANPNTGLMPEYSNFDGSPKSDIGKGDFGFDAFRCIMNLAMDYSWFKTSEVEKELVEKQLAFLHNIGIDNYVSGYTLDGMPTVDFNTTALISTNAVGALASESIIAWDFVDKFMQTGAPTGKYRYYDGMLYFLSLLHVSGNFKVYLPDSTTVPVPPVNNAPTTSITSPANNSQFEEGTAITINAEASDSDGTITKVEFFNGSTKLGEDTTQPYSYTISNSIAGNYTLTVKATDDDNAETTSEQVAVNVIKSEEPEPTPTTCTGDGFPITRRIQAEYYCNMSGVQVRVAMDIGGGFMVSQINKGDFMDYRVDVPKTGSYTLALRVSSMLNTGEVDIQVGGSSKGKISIPTTRARQRWTTVQKTIMLDGGLQTLRLFATGPRWNINWFKLTEVATPAPTTSCAFGTPSNTALPAFNSMNYQNAYVLGQNGPNADNITNFAISWSPAQNGLYQFALSTANGIPGYYVDLKSNITHSFNTVSPSLTITNSKVPNLDGSYWVTKNGDDFVMVSKTKGFTLYFTNSSNAPSCGAAKANSSTAAALSIYPNPVQETLRINGATEGASLVKVSDVLGKIVLTTPILGKSQNAIDVSSLKNGMYFLTVSYADGLSVTKSFVKK